MRSTISSSAKFVVIGLLASITAWSDAKADPATHTFAITSAQDTKGDCGGGSCANFCKLEGTLTNISTQAMPAASLMFKHPHPGLEPGALTTTEFSFAPQPPGATGTVPAWVNGLKCSEIKIQSVRAKCNGPICPYAAVRISPRAIPKLGAMKIDIDQ